jgi:hypothetical protein
MPLTAKPVGFRASIRCKTVDLERPQVAADADHGLRREILCQAATMGSVSGNSIVAALVRGSRDRSPSPRKRHFGHFSGPLKVSSSDEIWRTTHEIIGDSNRRMTLDAADIGQAHFVHIGFVWVLAVPGVLRSEPEMRSNDFCERCDDTESGPSGRRRVQFVSPKVGNRISS